MAKVCRMVRPNPEHHLRKGFNIDELIQIKDDSTEGYLKVNQFFFWFYNLISLIYKYVF